MGGKRGGPPPPTTLLATKTMTSDSKPDDTNPRLSESKPDDSSASSPSSPVQSSSKTTSSKAEIDPSGDAGGNVGPDTPPSDLQRVARLIKSGKAKNVILLLGAGISTSAGIPDFRSPETGLYANLQALDLPFPEAVFELGYFRKTPEPFWTLAKEIYPGKHFPTPTHYFLTLLHQHSALKRIFTQNIDTLETIAGVPPASIIEAHGSFASAHCLDCSAPASREYVLASGVRRGEVVRCESGCGGLVKPDIVFFGEGLPDKFFKHIPELRKCDLLIVIGTSLQVQPFASLVDYVPSTCPRLLINREAVGPFSRLPNSRSTRSSLSGLLSKSRSPKTSKNEEKEKRDMFWQGDADDGVWRLAQELGWKDELEQLVRRGRGTLEKEWAESTGNEQHVDSPPAKRQGGEEDAEVQPGNAGEVVHGVAGKTEKTEDEELEEAINKKLKL